MQSTPMLGGGGEVVGVLSTHFRQPRLPSPTRLHVTRLYADQAAAILVRLREEKDSRERQELVARELSHRVKNVLTMVQALSRQSIKGASGLAEMRTNVRRTIHGIVARPCMLIEGHLDGAGIANLCAGQLLAIDDRQIAWSGPDAPLKLASAAYYLPW